uniref:Uncharacterized protein n=1 Tax=Helianthus annuus TaxID=4232 RepID=A0A251V1E7_HELAN
MWRNFNVRDVISNRLVFVYFVLCILFSLVFRDSLLLIGPFFFIFMIRSKKFRYM